MHLIVSMVEYYAVSLYCWYITHNIQEWEACDCTYVCGNEDILRLVAYPVIFLLSRGRFGGGIPLRGWIFFFKIVLSLDGL